MLSRGEVAVLSPVTSDQQLCSPKITLAQQSVDTGSVLWSRCRELSLLELRNQGLDKMGRFAILRVDRQSSTGFPKGVLKAILRM